ncbi:MAG: universal stress protein [Rhodoferax sp.]
MHRKLMVVLDGGPSDADVAAQAIALARERRADLRAVYICLPLVLVGEGLAAASLAASSESQASLRDAVQAEGKAVLERVCTLGAGVGVYVRAQLLEHPEPVKEVARLAWRHGCEWIVAAVHSDSAWARLCGTSFTDQLLAVSRVPVLFCTQDPRHMGRRSVAHAGLRARAHRLEQRERRTDEAND